MSTIRIGLVRPNRVLRVIADAEARVIRNELERRLGPVSLDLRIDGDQLGRWLPRVHAAWPADIDTTIEASALWGEPARPITPLFARTVEPAAADTRRRMLIHLGVLPDTDFVLDDDFIQKLPEPVRPSDLWLIARAAASITVESFGIQALIADDATVTGLDHIFDEVATSLHPDDASTVAKLAAALEQARGEFVATLADAARFEVEADTRIAQLEAELATVNNRLARAELDLSEGTAE